MRVSDYKRMDRIDDSPVGSTGILDPVEQTGSPIQTDFLKTGTVDEPGTVGKYEYTFYGYGIGTERETDLRPFIEMAY